MAHELILQGLTKRTHAAALAEMLALDDIERIIMSVAFVSESGVELIEERLRLLAAKTTVFVGIRNDITSAQALRRLLDIGVTLYAVDTGSRLLIFHPKLYLVSSKAEAKLSIGSANLTLGGMNNNVEAGVLLSLNPLVADDAAILSEFETQFDGLKAAHPNNVLAITSTKLIGELLASGRVADEMALPPPRPSSTANSTKLDLTPRMKMKVSPLRRPPTAAKKPPKLPLGKVGLPAVLPTKGVAFELVWVSKELQERDLNIPSGFNTARTGSINLDKGMMDASVDHRHYFRDEIFPALIWPSQSGQVDTATASFVAVIKGVDHGTHTLTVRHTTSTTSRSYKQKNAMTRISWGTLAPAIRARSLLKRRMSLYRDKADATHFLIEID